MYQLKCERCNKVIAARSEYFTYRVKGDFATDHLCADCAKPILAVLKRLKLLPPAE